MMYLVTQRTRTVNKIKGIFNKHNMLQDAPTEFIRTNKFGNGLPKFNCRSLTAWKSTLTWTFGKHTTNKFSIESQLIRRSDGNKNLFKLTLIPGISAMGAIMLLSRIGDITVVEKNFERSDDLYGAKRSSNCRGQCQTAAKRTCQNLSPCL